MQDMYMFRGVEGVLVFLTGKMHRNIQIDLFTAGNLARPNQGLHVCLEGEGGLQKGATGDVLQGHRPLVQVQGQAELGPMDDQAVQPELPKLRD